MIQAMFVAHTAAPSGAELATLRLVSALRTAPTGRTLEPSVIYTEDGPMVGAMKSQGIPTSLLANSFDSRSVTIQSSGWLRRLVGALALIRVGWALGAAVREHGADVLVAGSTKALIMSAVAAKRARIPVIWHVHDRISAEYFGATLAFLLRTLGKFVADGYIANSRSTESSLRPGRLPGVVAYPGLDFQQTPDTQHAPQRPATETVIAVVGRLTPWKGQDVFLRALANTKVRPQRTYLVGGTFFGEEPFRTELEDLASELQLPVTFTGHLDDPTDILSISDILVHCSVIAEPFGQVVVEGLRAGCAVIATRPGGPAETIESGVHGLLVDAGDTDQLTDALDRLIADRDLRIRLAQAGQIRARRFDIADSALTVASFLSDVLARRSTTSLAERSV
ncbi:glycosyltransferase family 4 protein [Mycobacteroides franklinii]|uniref:GalNAc-alpha-(1->4)-GalNAc-alpha-(1->3)-diNAcBac-PP-undecaprenol alpha-1,4-N-acetyl-D-galactosaminyltransferase n=1 Tax=Mycobacteroides franklinii TaxID=948102 RepID=A0A4R8QSM4_9MYCO|nr:glycosyltransferase family 4 protein [Mycobacteroides franklinii]TDZ41630.1 GalNAc-alpha-(1->4)-GalNAc-alpha-(1->3)-diNAcBac-PP-undecaprenol alpha-1,4-N-acetyl-D-galactosaminyltransferase [Mycobacteroides franklinii]TDZ47055.1 GalNAc-alpha-(1->4)-GalNAc-alpha-(1->3)-diNAcBac-PP-undecaprenol alpha-1,4-N-acetyl-D-galactosaminyltransferase [Mycobacteroides franklinii]TDZ55184.1 GalNAc-alpha-(1->4)-GalNAc-alpha-(1->3)-diNAcBac-PP-undecaprenol alpha-1,4-N-acetyl-D-galactosaminyltransferase [Mycoba